jgi:hypothetical protein
MGKKFVVILSAFLILASPLCAADRGTFYAGTKAWYTMWDSGALKWYGNQLSENFQGWGIPISVDTKTGTGYLAGPLLGYQTANGKWNFSFAPMIISHFSQEQSITVLNSDPAYESTIGAGIDLERKDYDFALSYALSGLGERWSFFKYSKLFAGLKHQATRFELEVTRYTNGVPTGAPLNSGMKYAVTMPTVGFGIAYPCMKNVVMSLQAGIGMAFIDEQETVYNGYDYDLDPADSVSFNGELGLNYVPVQNTIVQLGYRYQQWDFDPRNGGSYPSGSYKDVNQGPSLAIVYTF